MQSGQTTTPTYYVEAMDVDYYNVIANDNKLYYGVGVPMYGASENRYPITTTNNGKMIIFVLETSVIRNNCYFFIVHIAMDVLTTTQTSTFVEVFATMVSASNTFEILFATSDTALNMGKLGS